MHGHQIDDHNYQLCRQSAIWRVCSIVLDRSWQTETMQSLTVTLYSLAINYIDCLRLSLWHVLFCKPTLYVGEHVYYIL